MTKCDIMHSQLENKRVWYYRKAIPSKNTK